MHTPHVPHVPHPLGLGRPEPSLNRVIASPDPWSLFAVDYSHFSNVTARQLSQLLAQASIPFIYSAGHNLEYVWVISLSPHFTCLLILPFVYP